MIRLCIALSLFCYGNSKLTFKSDGTFKILHLSDVHFRPGEVNRCDDILDSQRPCDSSNSTNLLNWLIEVEQPDLIVHTGDIIDGGSNPASGAMSEYYGVSYKNGLPWAASLGNHDDNAFTMPRRSEVLNFIVGLPGSLTEVGPVENTYGNFILEIFESSETPKPCFRTYHFDANTNDAAITKEQVDWFSQESQRRNADAKAPALAFYHIPLHEYQTAIDLGYPLSGGYHEAVCLQPTNTGLFEAMKVAGDIKAGFCGHDHTNDFCTLYDGVQLCYEGSPGYQAYGSMSPFYTRRARVTELRGFGAEVVSWKRLDNSTGQAAVIDVETLWADPARNATAAAAREASLKARSSVSDEYARGLPKKSQKNYSAPSSTA